MRSADEATAIENQHVGVWGEHALPLMETVVSSVINASAFLEAMVNELYADASDQHGLTSDGYLSPLDSNTVRLMADWWNVTNEGRHNVLGKYELLLSFAGANPLDRGAEPFQSAKLLTLLRNRIVHFRPEDIGADTVVSGERALKRMFLPSQLLPDKGPWWPNRALGAGCAHWAHSSAAAFADEVSARLGLMPNYQRVIFGRRP